MVVALSFFYKQGCSRKQFLCPICDIVYKKPWNHLVQGHHMQAGSDQLKEALEKGRQAFNFLDNDKKLYCIRKMKAEAKTSNQNANKVDDNVVPEDNSNTVNRRKIEIFKGQRVRATRHEAQTSLRESGLDGYHNMAHMEDFLNYLKSVGGRALPPGIARQYGCYVSRFLFYSDPQKIVWGNLFQSHVVTSWIDELHQRSTLQTSMLQVHLDAVLHGASYAGRKLNILPGSVQFQEYLLLKVHVKELKKTLSKEHKRQRALIQENC